MTFKATLYKVWANSCEVRTSFIRSSGLLHAKFWPGVYEIWGYFTRVRANFLRDADANANSSCAKTWSQPHTNFGPTSYKLRAYFLQASDLLCLCFGLNFLHYAGANDNLSIERNQSNFERTSIELFSWLLSKHHSVLVLIQSLQFWEVHCRKISMLTQWTLQKQDAIRTKGTSYVRMYAR